jgi:NitT/TauT family transport system permease protein
MISTIRKNKKLQRIIAILFWIIVWQILAILLNQKLILASPISVLINFLKIVKTKDFWVIVSNSFTKITLGLLLSILSGVILAIISAKKEFFEILLKPLINIIKSIPVVSFIILVLIWTDVNYLSTVISFLIVLPVIYANVLEGIKTVDKKLIEMADVFEIPHKKRLLGIYVPNVTPFLKAALSVALGLCWKSGVAAEVIGLPNNTIGEKLYTSKIFLSTLDVLTWTLVIIVISSIFEKVFIYLIKQIEEYILSYGEKI